MDCCNKITSLLSGELFKALADPTRIQIFAGLAQGGREQTVSEVAAQSAVSISVVSRHLKMLQRAGVLDAAKRGKEVFYTVRTADIVSLLRQLADAVEACCSDRGVFLQEDSKGVGQ